MLHFTILFPSAWIKNTVIAAQTKMNKYFNLYHKSKVLGNELFKKIVNDAEIRFEY